MFDTEKNFIFINFGAVLYSSIDQLVFSTKKALQAFIAVPSTQRMYFMEI
jgi:hypothetical protein